MFRRALVALCVAVVVPATAATTLSTFATQAIELALVRLATQYRAQTGVDRMGAGAQTVRPEVGVYSSPERDGHPLSR